MDTPLYDFLAEYARRGTVRAHMPGHKGRPPEGCGFAAAYPYDITEIAGADVLYAPEGIIAQSEENAATLFGTGATLYSAGGSTLCIQAMLAAVCGKGTSFICARNAHRAVLNSCALLDLEPLWLFPEYVRGSPVSGLITAHMVEESILRYRGKAPVCVFITSPDYLGRLAPVREIADVCHRYGLPLLVDNAHGAYLAFRSENLHPIALGADICCDSAHKTLPALTGAAYLHAVDGGCREELLRAMALFGGTSPSYLIMASLDLCNRYLAEDFRRDLSRAVSRVKTLKESIGAMPGTEPLKVTVNAAESGYTGYELANLLREKGIEPEYDDVCHVVMMYSASSTEEDILRTETAFRTIPKGNGTPELPYCTITEPERVMSVRDAFFAERETVPTEKALGRVSAENVTVCPPCVPIAAAGERINENIVKILKSYGISDVNVIK